MSTDIRLSVLGSNKTFILASLFPSSVKVQFRGPEHFKKKGALFQEKNTYLVYLCLREPVGDIFWVDGFNLNVILMFCRYDFVIRQSLHRRDSQYRIYQRRYGHVVVMLCNVWLDESSQCTCIVTSWSKRRRPKHGGLVDRCWSTCHAYGRKFAIKLQC